MKNMVGVILQPGYLPWLGFFEQMWKSNAFVFYDDVQFDKNGWRNRNRIKTAQGVQWLTVPVKVHLGEAIKDVMIDNKQRWAEKHLRAIAIAYSKSLFFEKNFQVISGILSKKWERLLDLDVQLILALNKILGLDRNIFFSSELRSKDGGKTGRLINICKEIGADFFYESDAGQNYIDAAEFENAGIELKYQNYKHPAYSQLHGEFTSFMSVIDLIFNEGPRSLEVLTNSLLQSS